MAFARLCLFATFFLCSLPLFAQSISGSSSVSQGSTTTYTFDNGTIYTSMYWSIVNGNNVSQSRSGSFYSVQVQWTTAGSGKVSFLNSSYQPVAVKDVTVNATACSTPASPSVTFTVATNFCGPKTITYTGSKPSSVTWYWQSTPDGTSTYNSTPAHDAGATGTYYVRAKTNIGECWSTSSSSPSINVTVNPLPAIPADFSISSNACGPMILTKPTAQAGTTLFWEGTDFAGTDVGATASAATYTANVTGTYVLRARDNSTLCWSTNRTKLVTVNDPPTPNSNTYAICEWESAVLTTTGYPAGATLKWYRPSDGTLLTTGLNYSVNNLTSGQYNFNVKAVNSLGCESQTPAVVTVTVPFNCDDKVNWSKAIAYTWDGTNEKEAASTMTYSDAFGKEMQSQSKVYDKNEILASQTLYNKFEQPVGHTLLAPINASNFAYRYNFVVNSSGQKYSWSDFDLKPTSGGLGEVFNPKPVGNAVGSLGHYYSTQNTREPLTPVTNFPYSRAYFADGPDPKKVTLSTGGDIYRMGSGHELEIEEFPIIPNELANYFAVRRNLISQVRPYGANLLAHVLTSSIIQFPSVNSNVSSSNGYLEVSNATTGVTTCGVEPIGGPVTVSAGSAYILRVKGYLNAGSAKMTVKFSNGTVYTYSNVLAVGISNEKWQQLPIAVPAGVTSMQIGCFFEGSPVPNPSTLFLSGVELYFEIPTAIGTKTITTDGNDKRTASFHDTDGNLLATANVTSANFSSNPPVFSYSDWAYSYYSEGGTLLATVAPNGVNGTASPTFVTSYKYDYQGRLIEVSSPDEGKVEYVYSDDGKLRFAQNAEQRNASPKRFTYFNYDYLGRVIETGEYTSESTSPYIFQPATTLTPDPASILQQPILNIVLARGRTMDDPDITTSNYSSIIGITAKFDSRCREYEFTYYDIPSSDYVATTGYSQDNLFGRIAKTKNENSTTWYSYNEFGMIKWSKQYIVELNISKTVEYLYDFNGNVTEVVFDKGGATPFYHRYMYDADGELSQVAASPSATTNFSSHLLAKYYYYLHGPLKRLELFRGNLNLLQGLDFVYTIRGELKAINSGDPAKDPNFDGILNPNNVGNPRPKDYFGETIMYNASDYSGAGYTAETLSIDQATYPDQFSGNHRNVTYHNATNLAPGGASNQRFTYAFQYTSKSQLSMARLASVSPSGATFTDAQKEGVTLYDNNDNIKGLYRYGKSGQQLAYYQYIYENNTNRLDKVNNSGSLLIDYSYNLNGQMVSQNEGTGKYYTVSYNSRGRVKEMRNGSDGKLIVEYSYDDRGNLFRKRYYTSDVLDKTVFYLNDAAGNVMAIYEKIGTGSLQLVEVPMYGMDRIGSYKPSGGGINYYEIKDHLGSVRAVIGAPPVQSYTASMESEPAIVEEPITLSEPGIFKNISAVRKIFSIANYTPPLAERVANVNYNEVVGLNANNVVGPTFRKAVSPGDIINVSFHSYYEENVNTAYNVPIGTAVLLNAMSAGFGGVSGAPGEPGQIYQNIQSLPSSYLGSASDDDVPAAYLLTIVYDKNYNRKFWNSKPIDNSADGSLAMYTVDPIRIEEVGYVYMCLYTLSNVQDFVYFDNLKVTITPSPIVAGADYYPFGLPQDGNEITDEFYRYGHQGEWAEKNTVTGWSEFELRMYEPRFGRWITPDPFGQYASPYVAMGNRPHMMIDPNGGFGRMPRYMWSGDALYRMLMMDHGNGPPMIMVAAKAIFDELIVKPSKAAVNNTSTFVNGIEKLITGDTEVWTTEGTFRFGSYEHYEVGKESAEVAGDEIVSAAAGYVVGWVGGKMLKGGKYLYRLWKPAKVIIKSFDDLVAHPKMLWGKTADQVGEILGEGWKRGAYGSKGTGWKFTKGDQSIFFHPGGGVHKGSYYGYSSGRLGKVKIVGKDYVPTVDDKAKIIPLSN